jgi:hypothetical protein
LKTTLWNLQINANIFLAAAIFYVIACTQTVIKGQISDTRSKVIVSASVSKKSSSAIIAYAITDSKGMFAITFQS